MKQFTLEQLAACLKADEVIAYPTEAVFGLGCNPHSETAVRRLLALKQRPESKGLILIAPTLALLLPFIDETALSEADKNRLVTSTATPVTWLVPAKANVPHYLTGDSTHIAVRLCAHPAVAALCEQTQFALTSTSANLSGEAPARTSEAVRQQFGENFPLLDKPTLGFANPSEIRELQSEQIIRKG